MLTVRAILFWLVMFAATLIISPLVVLTFPLPFQLRYATARNWARLNLWALRVICHIDYEVRGREHIPDQASIIFCKHQSTWETMALQAIFPPQVWVMKRELLRIPFFGWALAMLEPIAIDRSAGRQAVTQLVEQGKQRLAHGRWVVVFPEGTRVAPGSRGRYKIGGAVLAEQSGALVVPVAHNAGVYWPRHSFIKHPGTIQLVIGPPIDTQGKRAADILQQAEEWIESTVAQLGPAKPSA